MEFKTFDEISPAESISMLWYGSAGSGKTDAAGSYGERTLYIDVGKSSETFHGLSFKERRGPFKGIYAAINEEPPKGSNSLVPDRAIAYDRVCDAIDEALEKFPEKFDLIVVDEMTRFRRFAMNKAIEVGQGLGRSKTKENSGKYDVVIPGVQDFGAEMSLTEQFIAGYIDITKRYDKHFLVIAHERLTYRKGDKVGDSPTLVKTSPGFTGQTFPDDVSNLFDIVWHFEKFGSLYRVRTEGNDSIIAKTRYGGIFKEFEQNVSIPDMLRRIREQVPLPTKRK